MNEEVKINVPGNGNDPCATKPRCACVHHLTGPIIIIAIGVIMLLSVLGVLAGRGAGVALSAVVIIWGIMLAFKRSCRCCGKK